MWNRSATCLDRLNIDPLNIDLRKQCELFGFTKNHENESILIFHSCSSNINVGKDQLNSLNSCNELHIGNTPRSIMTKGNSISYGTRYGNFIKGNRDKLMITYRREPSHDYAMTGACGVLFEGEIHFFGGYNYTAVGMDDVDLTRQHFVIETKRSGQLVKMTKKGDLEIGFEGPSCSSFEFTSDYFPWFKTNVVILCFDTYHQKSCYSFDGTLNDIGDSNFNHLTGGLTKYKRKLLTACGSDQKTELLEKVENKNFSWSIVESDFKFTESESIEDHSLVTIESSDIHEEYVLFIGGIVGGSGVGLDNVFKFNGTWSLFGQLNKPRVFHNSIYWNEAVYVIGGNHDWNDTKTKMEIWNIKDSPDRFETKENWPELFDWYHPYLFIVPDSFFPDH